MEDQNQRRIETLAPRMPECLEEHQNKDKATQPYHLPQVFLVGKAKHLIAGNEGNWFDTWDRYCFCRCE